MSESPNGSSQRPRSALIALGANLGDREATLERALEGLVATVGVTKLRRSRRHETAPVGGPAGQPAFLNAAAVVETTLEPEALLDRLFELEREAGRQRDERWSARTLDLDLLLFEDETRCDRRLWLPHPRLAVRRFVLGPAAEVAPKAVDPTSGLTLLELLAASLTSPPRAVLLQAAGDERARQVATRAASGAAFPIERRVAEELECLGGGRPRAAERVLALDDGTPRRVTCLVLDEPASPGGGALLHPALAARDRSVGRVLERLRTNRAGPVLVLSSRDPTAAAAEIVAATQALS